MQWPFRVVVRGPLPRRISGWAEIVGEYSTRYWEVGQVYVHERGVTRHASLDERAAVEWQLKQFGSQIDESFRKTAEPRYDDYH